MAEERGQGRAGVPRSQCPLGPYCGTLSKPLEFLIYETVAGHHEILSRASSGVPLLPRLPLSHHSTQPVPVSSFCLFLEAFPGHLSWLRPSCSPCSLNLSCLLLVSSELDQHMQSVSFISTLCVSSVRSTSSLVHLCALSQV